LTATFYSAVESIVGSAAAHVAVLPILSAGAGGRIITGVSQNTLLSTLNSSTSTSTSISVSTIVLVLVHYSASSSSGTSYAAAAGDEATEFKYVSRKDVGAGEFTFVDDAGNLVSSINGTGNAHLVLNVADQSDYDLDRAVGSVSVSPVLAKAESSSSGRDGGGGGCDAGLMGMVALLAVAGGYFFMGKRRA
jgi:hypothetical protein